MISFIRAGTPLQMENGSVYPGIIHYIYIFCFHVLIIPKFYFDSGIPNGYGTPLQNRRYPPSVTESSPYKYVSCSCSFNEFS